MAVKGDNLAQSRRAAEKVRLGDIVDIIGGGTPSKKREDFYRGAIPWATVRDMNCDIIKKTEFCITDEAVENSATNVIPKGEVVISTHVGLGKVCVLGQDTAINQDLKAIIPHQGVFRRYMYYWFCSQADILIRNGKGATVKGVTLDFVRALQIPLPPLPTQRRIAAELDKICELKKNAETRLEKLDLLVKSRFVEMFGDLKSVVAIGDRFETQSGGTPKSSEKEFYENGNIPWLTSGEVGQGIVRKVDRRITQAGLDNSSAKWTPIDSVLVAMYGATAGKVGLLKIRATTNQAVCSILPAQGMIPEFVYYAVSSKTDWMIQQAAGGAQPNISQGVVRKMRIPNPPLALQREFAAFVAKVDKLRVNVRETVAKMDMLYRSKLQEYFG